MSGLSLRLRLVALGIAAVVLGAAAVGYAVVVRGSAGGPAPIGTVLLTPGPRLAFVTQGRLATVEAADPTGPRAISDTPCVRVYAAAGTGICLRQDDPWTYSLHVLDERLGEGDGFRIPGLANRARVSPSGALVAWTTFIGGESYNRAGFSTRTGILDTRTGDRVMSLEEFTIIRDGQEYDAADVNFWGVTFADDSRFYATMATDGRRFLVEGDLAARTVRTVTINVECPSLSPDGTRIAFKQAIDDDPTKGWRLSVLDLADLRVTHLAERRSIDDQPAWLDDDTVAYTFRDSTGAPSVWTTPADGSGSAQLLVKDAESPAPL